jgi:hypothetical protein
MEDAFYLCPPAPFEEEHETNRKFTLMIPLIREVGLNATVTSVDTVREIV